MVVSCNLLHSFPSHAHARRQTLPQRNELLQFQSVERYVSQTEAATRNVLHAVKVNSVRQIYRAGEHVVLA